MDEISTNWVTYPALFLHFAGDLLPLAQVGLDVKVLSLLWD